MRLVSSVAAALALAGCATTVSGAGRPEPSKSTSSSADFPSTTSAGTVPVTPSTPATANARPSASGDVNHVQYHVPDGFTESHDYSPVIPLEPHWVAHYFIPANAPAGRDVLSVTIYTLPGPHLVDSRSSQVARVKAYNRKVHATLRRKIAATGVGGRLAFEELAVEPGDYRYASWFVFGSEHLLQISCQVGTQTTVVADGCSALVKSIVIE